MTSSDETTPAAGSNVPTVSVIVPVFNVSQYVGETLESLLTQTLREIEIIVVDDASTDQTWEIVQHASQDPRITALKHVTNQGPGAARNTGLDAASGKYIAFADGDDLADPKMLETMVSAAESNDADIVTCGFATFSGEWKGVTGADQSHYPIDQVFSGRALDALLERGHRDKLYWFNPLFLYRRQLIEDCGVRFNVGVPLGQDSVFNAEILRCATSLVTLSESLYRVRRREASQTSHGSPVWNGRIALQSAALRELYDRMGLWEQVHVDYHSYVLAFQLPQAVANARSRSKSRREFAEYLRELGGFTWVRDSLACREAWKELSLKRRIINWLIMRERYGVVARTY